MDHSEKIAETILGFAKNMPHLNTITAMSIQNYAYDLATICKNIKETSISEADRHQRCERLSRESGMDLSQIKLLTN